MDWWVVGLLSFLRPTRLNSGRPYRIPVFMVQDITPTRSSLLLSQNPHLTPLPKTDAPPLQ